MDVEQLRQETLGAIDQIGNALRSNADTVETKYLERLIADRDDLLAYAHFTLQLPVMALSSLTGIWWTQIYDSLDRVKARSRAHWLSGFKAAVDPEPTATDLEEGGS